ncbi:4-hydroxy-3-methylbut-2-enyl diphosphate reductase [uncultured Phascolarctobacterium sp.]|uniref:4-hydroxy-3-methylbut-2-enyl diphosphate reductase n=1 Tax=uncultured Phascolarctobacterium sp. TaxID=512296 RepID=UPI0026128AA8|nr:4-hydroxy-3-methylbut-2-enyl diphosphate reductase [uncultured Phascolarctobacterium sp.]
MEIKVAKYCGFCYGVKRAVELAQKAADEHVKGGTLGPLIHNPQLIDELAHNGIACKNSLDEFLPGETVIFRSHGVGPEIYAEAKQKGLEILDATCPNVRLAQKKAAQAAADGFLPIIVGEKNHPEVKSILKWAGKSAICIEYIKDISCVPQRERYGVIIQTTFELQKFEDILRELKKQRPGEYRVERTICLATAQRQKAAVELAQESDAVIVIGGRNSANTRHLCEVVQAICSKVYHIETASELNAAMLRGCNKIGITAGASTPDRLIKEAIIAMENMDFESMLNESMEVEVYPGKIVNGTVIQLDKDGVYVSFGYRHDGLITYAEWNPAVAPEELMETIKIGDEVEAKVIPGSTKSDFVRLSKVKAERDAAWKNVAELAEGEKRAATVKVLRIIKNKAKNIVGLAVAVEGVEGFMPASHVELRRVEDFAPYIGQELQAEIIEVDLEKKRIVVSRRDLLKAEREAKAKAWKEQKEAQAIARKEARAAAEEAAYASVEEGQVVPGKVVKVAEFGLFVEVGAGLVGLVHNTELSWDRSVKAADVANEGDEVTVLVKRIDRENKRVALSIKATQEDPWMVEAGKFHIGDILEVEVTRFLPFGAIVKLSEKVEGLVHISEIAQERIAKPDDALELGQVVKAEVIKMDLDSKKIGLSISKVKRDAEKNEYRSYIGKKNSSLTQDLSEQLENLEK